MTYKVWVYTDDQNQIMTAQLASVGIYDVWVWFQTTMARYYFKQGDGKTTNVLIIPIAPVGIDAVMEEAKNAIPNFLAQIIGSDKASQFQSNLNKTQMNLAEFARALFMLPDWWQTSNDQTATETINVIISKVELTDKDLMTIASAANQYYTTLIRTPVANICPIKAGNPCTIIAIPRVNINQADYYQEFNYEMNSLFKLLYENGLTKNLITVQQGKIEDIDTLEDVLIKIGLITKYSIPTSNSQSSSSSSSSSS